MQLLIGMEDKSRTTKANIITITLLVMSFILFLHNVMSSISMAKPKYK